MLSASSLYNISRETSRGLFEEYFAASQAGHDRRSVRGEILEAEADRKGAKHPQGVGASLWREKGEDGSFEDGTFSAGMGVPGWVGRMRDDWRVLIWRGVALTAIAGLAICVILRPI